MSTPFLSLGEMSEMYNFDQDWLFDRLLKNLCAEKNLIILAEREVGLQEYVNELRFQLAEKHHNIHVCRIDLKQAHDSESFLQLYEATLSNIFPEVVINLKRNQGHIEVLKLPGMIYQRKKTKLAVFLANSHLFSRYRDRDSFLRQLKLTLRNQRHCIFCLYGIDNQYSRSLVESPGPLSGLGRLVHLKQNPTEDRAASIRKIFQLHDKNIPYRTSIQMSYLVENHPFYLKLLVWHALLRTTHTCNPEIIKHAFEDLIHHFDYHFRKVEEGLTENQRRFLKALLEGNQKLYSTSRREKHRLGSTSTVARVKIALEKKEIIKIGIGDFSHHDIFFMDPVFREWFRKRYGTPE
jgi:hypothetical protein